MNDNYPKACTEVLAIIPYIEQEYVKKIPTKFIALLEKISDKKYVPNLDISKNLKNQELLDETRAILALLYRDYICSKEERKKLLLQENKEKERIEKEKKEKYSVDFQKLVENRRRDYLIKDEQLKSENALIEVTETKWYKKIFTKILNFFKRNNKNNI